MKRMSLAVVTALCVLVLAGSAPAQSKVSFGQTIGVLKKLKPDLNSVGVLSTTTSKKDAEAMARTALQQGVKVFVAIAADVREVPQLYKTLVGEKKVQVIVLPDADDRTMTGMGFDFLKENALTDRVGICAPTPGLVAEGAVCCVSRENDKVVAYVNQKVLGFINAAVPTEESSSISFVLR